MRLPRFITIENLYFLGLAILVASLPLSRFSMSVSQFVLIGTWIIELNYRQKLRKFFSNRIALILSSLFLLHLLGLLYTTDFQYAVKDLRTKIPLLLFPLVFSTMTPLSEKRIRILLGIYVIAVFSGTMRSTYEYFSTTIYDTRTISVYISHIRFALNICMALFILVYLIMSGNRIPRSLKWIMIVVSLWFVCFLFVLQSITGILILIAVTLALVFYYTVKTVRGWKKVLMFSGMLLIPLLIVVFLYNTVNKYTHIETVDFSNLDMYTANGNPYIHDTLGCQTENGNYIWLYLSVDELKESWNRRSNMAFEGRTEKGFRIKDVLIRYMTSKGLRKDSIGMTYMSDRDIRAVEQGATNYIFGTRNTVGSRIYDIVWEFMNYLCTGNPSSHSVLQRYEYWKASVGIIRNSPVCGVGTGDLNIAFSKQYEEMNSPLEEQWRRRSHNQYLSIMVAFGVIGLAWFLFVLIYPPITLKRFSCFLYSVFFLIAALSMLWEDTIESQAGVTFFAFFNTFLLLVGPFREK